MNVTPYTQKQVDKWIAEAKERVAADKEFQIQGLNRTIEEQGELVEVLRRIEHALGYTKDKEDLMRHVLNFRDEVVRLKSLDELNGRYIAERDKQLLDLKVSHTALLRLLNRVPHHGPNGSYSKAEGQCWADCVACEYEKISGVQPSAVTSAASGPANNPAEL